MAGISLEDGTTRALTTALTGLTARQRVISNNLANVDTPGFKAGQVSFARALDQARGASEGLALQVTNPVHLASASSGSAGIEYGARQDTSQRIDGNNVDLDRELASLSETAVDFQATTRMVNRRLSILRTAINEGRR